MSLTIAIPDTHVRRLSDAVLIDRLARDLAAGFRSGKRVTRVGGYPVVVNDEQVFMSDWAESLERRTAGSGTVTRHSDGSTDVVLSHAVAVHLHPRSVSA